MSLLLLSFRRTIHKITRNKKWFAGSCTLVDRLISQRGPTLLRPDLSFSVVSTTFSTYFFILINAQGQIQEKESR